MAAAVVVTLVTGADYVARAARLRRAVPVAGPRVGEPVAEQAASGPEAGTAP